MNGAQRITAERRRQVEEEGFTPERDDVHRSSEMVMAASAFCWAAQLSSTFGVDDPSELQRFRPDYWPPNWHPSWWKPSIDPIRNLEKAGALIAAEIDRLLRQREGGGTDGTGD